jgi:hypothetical protein
MTVQHDHQQPTIPRPTTLRELRAALSRYGLPGDRELFESSLQQALDDSLIGDLAAVAEVIDQFRDRLALRTDPQAMASLAAPIGGQKWTPAGEAFARIRAGGDE